MKGARLFKTIGLTLLALSLGLVLAVGTPAGTEIRNQASASYIDSAGQSQTTTSNEVITVVQPVYGFTITPDGTETTPGQTQSAVPGGTAYFPYTITNTGNTADTITLATAQSASDDFDPASTIYLDENCNGQIDPAESSITEISLAADASACLILAATVPTSASGGDEGLVNIEGTSQGDSTKTDTNNWAKIVATENAALTATKSASPTGEVATDSTIAYTIEGSNVGGSDAYAVSGVVTVDGSAKNGIFISDPIPTGTTYVRNSADGTAGAGSVSVIYQTASGWTATEPSNASDVTAVGLLIEGSGAFFPQGAQYQLSFEVTVNSGLAAGTSIENTATVKFDANGDGDAEDPGETVDSNPTYNTVAISYAVLNGPYGEPEDDGDTTNDTFTYNGVDYEKAYNASNSTDDDTETITSDVYGGDTVYFPFTLQNNGNTDDSFNLAVAIVDPDTTDTIDPTTWTCQIVASDGVTPISGAVGPFAAGDTFNYVVKCTIPAAFQETDSNIDAARIEVKAISVGDSTKTNKVTGIVTDVQPGYGVDIDANPGDNGGATGDGNPPAQVKNPGDTVMIPFDVHNTGQNPDTYDLTTTLPTGWTGTIYPDSNCDGAMDDPVPAPVTDTGLMNAGDAKCFILVVDVPSDQAPVDLDGTAGTSDDNVEITATSNANPSVTDTISTDIEVNAVYALAFTPDRSGTVTSPGTIVYTHTVTNNGNTSVDVSFSIEGSTHPTWTYQISTDGGSTWTDVSSGQISGLAAGASQEVQIRVIVPDGEPIGAVDSVTITAEAEDNTGTARARASVADTTTVVGGDLRLEKEVDKTEAAPGDVLTYTITASNIGTADLKQVIISDQLPAYTDFVSVSATISGFTGTVLYSTDGSTWSATAPTSLSAGGIIYVAVDNDNATSPDGTITDADTMPPGAEIVITFKVQVQ
ncbi:beta strand repeat-containing protein [Oceanithermus sp.]